MNNLRRVLIVLISSLIVVIFTSCSTNEFVVNNSISEIKDGIESFIDRDSNNEVKIELKSTRNIDNIKIVAFSSTEQDYGYAILENQSTDTYKIRSAAFCEIEEELPTLETSSGKYFLSVGANYNIYLKYMLPNNKNFLSGLRSLLCP